MYKRQVYVGNGKVVEALNESLGVVYRDVASTGKIVVIGRPYQEICREGIVPL